MGDRDETLRTACDEALVRLATAQGRAAQDAALGEVLFWLVALAEATGRAQAPEAIGLRWARDRIARGTTVVAPIQRRDSGTIGDYLFGRSGLGSPPGMRWIGSGSIAIDEDEPRDLAGRSSYDANVGGRDVLEPIRAVLELSADPIDEASDRLRPSP